MKLRKSGMVSLLVALLITACGGGKTVVESDLKIAGAPDWVNEGTQILNSKDGRLFHGIGSAPKMDDMSLQKSTAENRARSEVARILSSYMDVVSRDYIASTKAETAAPKAEDASHKAEEATETRQTVSRSIDNITKVNLTGVKIIANWRDDKDGTIYTLAELDMNEVKEILKTTQDMNDGLRMHIDQNGDNIFDKMTRSK